LDNTIVVLPFADMSPDGDQAYLSDGIAEELLNLLAKVPELRVVSRTSAFAFKGKDLTVAELAGRLGVAHVLEGSVRTSGDRVRITAQLIDARQDVQLWSERWDRTLIDVFAIQDEIAGSVVAALQVELLGQVPSAEKTDLSAWSIYLQARHQAASGIPDNMAQATALFREALAIDPGFVPAWVGLGVNFANLQSLKSISPAEAHRELLAAAHKVLELDSKNADGYALLAFASDQGDGDYANAVRNYRRALEIDPNNLLARNGLAVMYSTLGEIERAIDMQERLLENDPLSQSIYFNLGMSRVAAGDLEGANQAFKRALSINPDMLLGHVWRGIIDLLQGNAQSTLEIFERLNERTGNPLFTHIGQAMALPALGDEAGGSAALAELERGWGQSFAFVIATIHAWQSRPDRAFEWLEHALENNGPAALAKARTDPMLNSLHDDVRWQPLLERAGLSDAQVEAILVSN
jgi:TolB-like protein/Flp pilus assembly protein TadD